MAYEFLKKLFGTQKDGEEPKAMTYAELEAAIDADKKIQVVDVKAGGYVSKEKLDAKITELDGVRQQLTDANAEIKSYKEMDIDGIKKSAKDWEDKYNHDTQELNDKLAKQERDHQMDRYLDTVGLKPGAMYRDYVRRAFEAKELKLENGKFIGADDVMKELRRVRTTKKHSLWIRRMMNRIHQMFRMNQGIHRHQLCRTSQQEPIHRPRSQRATCLTLDFLE